MAMDSSQLQHLTNRPRLFILTDISNEPDDAESLVRYLLYANQFCTEGLVAVTSTWMKTKVCPQDVHKIIDGYGAVVDNLNKHCHPSSPYPSADYLRGIVASGPPVYGFQGVGDDAPFSQGAKLLLERLRASSDEEPLWVLIWGGANVLAQALYKIRGSCSESEAAALRARLRVYAISDQDDTGIWIRTTFPDVFYICSIHAWNNYGMATWCGISGDHYYGFDQGGPRFSKLTKEWFREHIQIGPLGSKYPDYMFIPEGDTPTFLYLIQNGLGAREHPEYGSWGGRYNLTDPSTNGLRPKHYSDCADTVIGQDGKSYKSNQATIWRWRDAYQNDFAARMQWTLSSDRGAANHHPVVCLNGSTDTEVLFLEAEAGSTLRLDATGTYDPDGDALAFSWWQYLEPSASQWSVSAEVGRVKIEKVGDNDKVVHVILPSEEECCVDLLSRQAVARGQRLHVVLEVTDSGSPPLTCYRRAVIQTTNKKLRGGGLLREAIGDA